jgi:anaerobic magnesium-protoporphyrin IX monomethyl ester cyclase
MKVMIAYPPLESDKGIPLLGQNRQFQWFNSPTYIYPMVPASAASLLKCKGHDVVWTDGIAEGMSYEEFLDVVRAEEPDVVAMETKTPVVKRHWLIVEDLKNLGGDKVPLVVLFGDHVTALPDESMENCPIDFVLTGGDYDFLLANLANHLDKGEALEPGIWYRESGDIKNTGHFALNHDLESLPFIDRDLTRWRLYSEKNGNYKYLPGTYTMAARDCWWGLCSFCSWTTLYPGQNYRARSPQGLLDEIGILIEKYGVKEIMDDSGSFPVGEWLTEFCHGMIERGYNKKIRLDCNMRFGKLIEVDYRLMRQAGFRFILFGLESGNQKTLDRIHKNIRVEDIEIGLKAAKEAGLEPHITVMMGYPWESLEDAERTVKLARDMFNKGYVDTLQATIVMPYPGTPLFKECIDNGWLVTDDWDRFDMREPIMKSPLSEDDTKALTRELYKAFMTPRFFLKKLMQIRKPADIAFFWRAGWKLLGHLLDFKNNKNVRTYKLDK